MPDTTIQIRYDGYVNITALCVAGGKSFGDWKRNKKTQQK